MRNATLRFLALVIGVFLISGAAPVQAQGTFAHGAVVALQGTPHLWFADEQGLLHWGGDTRALAGKHIVWSNRVEVSLEQLRTLPVGDPWLTAGLLKDGDPIYQVKWESEWPLPKLLHIQSIKDVELFGINGSNYGNFVIEKSEWERRFGVSAAGLQRSTLAAATSLGAVAPTSPASDRDVLIAFYNATGGASWARKQNWVSDAPLNLWYGVETDENGRVIKLDLDTGARWGGNQLRGSLPAELGYLTNLEVLELGDNRLTGPLPAELGNLTRLKVLSLFGNDLSGPLPVELGNLTYLERLVLNNNRNLSRLLPQSLTGLTRLTEFKFGNTRLCPPADSAFRTWLQRAVRGTFSLWPGCNVTLSPASTPEPKLASDRDALIALYNATGGANWLYNKYWLSDEPIGRWHGVRTDENGRVTRLVIHPPGGYYGNNMVGSLPAALGHLTHLEALFLGEPNNLSGSLPHSMTRLTNLRSLSISRGLCVPANDAFRVWIEGIEHFSGRRCPSALGDRDVLVALYHATGGRNWGANTYWLSDAPIHLWHGVQTDENGRVTKLELDHGGRGFGNNLVGSLPAELGHLAHLEVLKLSNNNLTGPLPAALGNLTKLKVLELYNNDLAGPLPAELGNLSSLELLDFYSNSNLGGPLPQSLTRLTRLKTLKFGSTKLCPPANSAFRTWLQRVTIGTPSIWYGCHVSQQSAATDRAALVALYNATDGKNWGCKLNWLSNEPIGLWCGVATDDNGHVTRLNLSRSWLTGPLPAELGSLTHLEELLLSDNLLTGPLPAELGNLTKLEVLSLRNNNLTGPLPASWGNLTNLKHLYLDENSLTGPLPVEWSNLTNILSLKLDSNRLTGPIPTEWGNLTRLDLLWLSGNNLRGALPHSMTKLTRLRGLYLSNTGLCVPADSAFEAWTRGIDQFYGQWGCPAA